MDQIQTSSSGGGLLHFFFDRHTAAKLQLNVQCCLPPQMMPAKWEFEQGENEHNSPGCH